MGDTGAMSLGLRLDDRHANEQCSDLAIIGLVFLIESIFSHYPADLEKTAPWQKSLHLKPDPSPFRSQGWSEPKIVMRFWVIAGVRRLSD